MRGNNFSTGKFALISTITIFLIGFSMASFNVEADSYDGEKYTSGDITIEDAEGQFIGLWTGKDFKNSGQLWEQRFDERPKTGEDTTIGIIKPEGNGNSDVGFGDEVKIEDGSGDEVSIENLEILQQSNGQYYFFVPKNNPDLNKGDILKSTNRISKSVKIEDSGQTLDLTGGQHGLSLDENTGIVNIYDPIENIDHKVYLDNKALKLDARKAEDSKTEIIVDVDNPGPAPINESKLKENGDLIQDLFELEPTRSMLGKEGDIDYDLSYENEKFTIKLSNKFMSSDEVNININESSDAEIRDVVGNQPPGNALTVSGLNTNSPKVRVEFDKEDIPLGDEVDGEVFLRSVDEPEVNLEAPVLDITEQGSIEYQSICGYEGWNECYSKEFTVRYSSGPSGELQLTAEAQNDNGETTETGSINAITGAEKVSEIEIKDPNSDGYIETVDIFFNELIDEESIPDSFGGDSQWEIERIDLEAGKTDYTKINGQNEIQSKISTKVPESEQGSIDLLTTDAENVDVKHQPMAENHLEFESGAMVEEIDEGTIAETDKAAPVLEYAYYTLGYDKMVLEFSEPVTEIIESEHEWQPEIAASSGGESKYAVATLSDNFNSEWEDEGVWIEAEDSKGNEQDDYESVGYSQNDDLIGVSEGWNTVSLSNFKDIVGSQQSKLSEEFGWIEMAYDYNAGWEYANTLGPEKATFVDAARPGVLEVEQTNSMPANLRTVNGQWNLISTYDGPQEIGFVDSFGTACGDQDANNDLRIIPTETASDICGGSGDVSVTSVVGGYWVKE